jgi:hypothetical protein
MLVLLANVLRQTVILKDFNTEEVFDSCKKALLCCSRSKDTHSILREYYSPAQTA